MGGRRRVRGAAGSGDTPPAAARYGAKAAAGGGDKPRQATGRKGKARKAPEDDEPLSAAGRDERPEAAGTRGKVRQRADRKAEGEVASEESPQEDSDASTLEDESDESV